MALLRAGPALCLSKNVKFPEAGISEMVALNGGRL